MELSVISLDGKDGGKEAALLAAAADPEREYVEVILPRKLQAAADYADRATLWSDLGVLASTLHLLVARRAPQA